MTQLHLVVSPNTTAYGIRANDQVKMNGVEYARFRTNSSEYRGKSTSNFLLVFHAVTSVIKALGARIRVGSFEHPNTG